MSRGINLPTPISSNRTVDFSTFNNMMNNIATSEENDKKYAYKLQEMRATNALKSRQLDIQENHYKYLQGAEERARQKELEDAQNKINGMTIASKLYDPAESIVTKDVTELVKNDTITEAAGMDIAKTMEEQDLKMREIGQLDPEEQKKLEAYKKIMKIKDPLEKEEELLAFGKAEGMVDPDAHPGAIEGVTKAIKDNAEEYWADGKLKAGAATGGALYGAWKGGKLGFTKGPKNLYGRAITTLGGALAGAAAAGGAVDAVGTVAQGLSESATESVDRRRRVRDLRDKHDKENEIYKNPAKLVAEKMELIKTKKDEIEANKEWNTKLPSMIEKLVDSKMTTEEIEKTVQKKVVQGESQFLEDQRTRFNKAIEKTKDLPLKERVAALGEIQRIQQQNREAHAKRLQIEKDKAVAQAKEQKELQKEDRQAARAMATKDKPTKIQKIKVVADAQKAIVTAEKALMDCKAKNGNNSPKCKNLERVAGEANSRAKQLKKQYG